MSDSEYTYLKVPPVPQFGSCAGLILAGMAARAKVGVGGLEEAGEVLASLHSSEEPTHYRFRMKDEEVVVEVEDRSAVEGSWRTVVELVS